MLDGVGLSIKELQNFVKHQTGDNSCMIIAITDGEENSSGKFNKISLPKLINEVEAEGNWTVAVQVPKGHYKRQLVQNFNIAEGNIREWEQTIAGVQETEQVTSRAIGTYFQGRSTGQRSTKKLFEVTTDLSQVTKRDIKANLVDMKNQFKAFVVPKEEVVKEFVERKTRKNYVLGSTYYQLMKTEKVQPQKQILIVEKGKDEVWGGQEARDLIGLPPGVEAKVIPGNHSKYDIYVQSTSVNRKLPRGTKVLLDTKAAGV